MYFHITARLAQSAVRKALNLVVVGPSPTVGAMHILGANIFRLHAHCAQLVIGAMLDRSWVCRSHDNHDVAPHNSRRSRQLVSARAAFVRALRVAGDWQAGGSRGMPGALGRFANDNCGARAQALAGGRPSATGMWGARHAGGVFALPIMVGARLIAAAPC
jgi:hypothetical protein